MESRSKALAIAKAASDKKALDIQILDMRKVPSVCDYFLIASGNSTTHVRAISDHILDRLREKGERVWHTEGEREALWILLDYGDIVAHVFEGQTRRFYELEKLWGGVPVKKFKDTPRRVKRPARKARTKKRPVRRSRRKPAR